MEAPAVVERVLQEAPVLDIRRLTTEFKTHAGPLRAVNEISFTLPRGRVLAIIGESGSGKSALLRTILGIQPDERPHRGRDPAQWRRPLDALAAPARGPPRRRCLDGVPGPDDRARSDLHGRTAAGGDDSAALLAQPTAGQRPRPGAAGARADPVAGAAAEGVSVRAERWDAAARRDRHGACLHPEPACWRTSRRRRWM